MARRLSAGILRILDLFQSLAKNPRHLYKFQFLTALIFGTDGGNENCLLASFIPTAITSAPFERIYRHRPSVFNGTI